MVRFGMISSALCVLVSSTVFAQSGNAQLAYAQPPEFGVGSLPFAYGQLGAARAADRIASSEFNLTVIRLQREFELSPDYQAALQSVADARDSADAAEKPILKMLAGDPQYQDLSARRLKIQMVLAEDHDIPLRDLWDLAVNKMEYGSKMHQMEADALASDPAVQTTRKQLVAAQKKLDLMRESFEATLYKNPKWAAAKQQYNSAEIALNGAEYQAIGANVVACLTVDSDVRHVLYSGYNSPFGEPYVSPAYYGRRY